MSFDCNKDRLVAVSRLDEAVDEPLEPDARVQHHAFFQVLAQEDAALRVCGGVASVDADALELGHVYQQGEPFLKLGRVGHHDGVSSFGNGGLALCLASFLAGCAT